MMILGNTASYTYGDYTFLTKLDFCQLEKSTRGARNGNFEPRHTGQ